MNVQNRHNYIKETEESIHQKKLEVIFPDLKLLVDETQRITILLRTEFVFWKEYLVKHKV